MPHDNIDLSGCCKMLHDISAFGLNDVDPTTKLYRLFRRHIHDDDDDDDDDDDVSIIEERKDYFMIEDKNDKTAIGILLLAGILTLGGFICLAAMFIKHM